MRNFAAVLTIALALPAAALAQERYRKWTFGLEAGVTSGVHESFVGNRWWIATDAPITGLGTDCRVNVVDNLGFAVGRRLTRWMHVDGVLSLQAGPGSGCADGLLPPVDVVEATYIGRTIGVDYVSTHIRAVFDPGRSTVRPRATIGLGWIPAKKTPSVALGAGVSAGSKGARFVSELGVQAQRIDWTREFRCYGNCGTRTGMRWLESGTSTPLQVYGRVGVEF